MGFTPDGRLVVMDLSSSKMFLLCGCAQKLREYRTPLYCIGTVYERKGGDMNVLQCKVGIQESGKYKREYRKVKINRENARHEYICGRGLCKMRRA
jgi:hypothetical protein